MNRYCRRTTPINRITIFCVPHTIKAPYNYTIDKTGGINVDVPENRYTITTKWVTRKTIINDEQSVSIYCDSSCVYPQDLSNATYRSLIDLCVDICVRNDKTCLLWWDDECRTVNYTPRKNEMILTLPQWFGSGSCGAWLKYKMYDFSEEVTHKLSPQVPPKYIVCAGGYNQRENAEICLEHLRYEGHTNAYIITKNN